MLSALDRARALLAAGEVDEACALLGAAWPPPLAEVGAELAASLVGGELRLHRLPGGSRGLLALGDADARALTGLRPGDVVEIAVGSGLGAAVGMSYVGVFRRRAGVHVALAEWTIDLHRDGDRDRAIAAELAAVLGPLAAEIGASLEPLPNPPSG